MNVAFCAVDEIKKQEPSSKYSVIRVNKNDEEMSVMNGIFIK